MRLSNQSLAWTEKDWQPFAATRLWQLANGPSGLRTTYAQFKGSRGGISTPVSDTIYLTVNGDFESGALGWQWESNPLPVTLTNRVYEKDGSVTWPADGVTVALLGDPDYACMPGGVPLGYAAIGQPFSVPQSGGTLTFKYIIWSQDASIGSEYDRFEVYVNSKLMFSDGNQVNEGLGCSQWRRVPGPSNPRNGQTHGWATGKINLGSYAGQNVVIAFRVYNRYDGWYNTFAFVDSVTLNPAPGEG
jgi:hypothetical protein